MLVGSHKHHAEFAKVFGLTEHVDDWFKLTASQVEWYMQKGCVLHEIEYPAGSHALWLSRTVHAGRAPVRGRPNPGRHRFVAYVCYSPRAWLSEEHAAKKKKALEEGRVTSHWPHWPKLFPKNPRTYGKTLNSVASFRPPSLTDKQRDLAYSRT